MNALMLAGVFFLSWNPAVQFLCSALLVISMIWGVIWAGIRLWHKRQVKELAKEITPLLDSINKRLDSQDRILENVEHEVLLNNGTSLKDSVNRIEENQNSTKQALESTQKTTNETLKNMSKDITNIRIDQAKHLGVHEGMRIATEVASASG